MGKIRKSNKTCSTCFEQISGNNSCFCSIHHFSKKQNKKSFNKEVKIRRTERIKRGRPDYFDILEYEKQERRDKKQRAKSKSISSKQIKNNKNNKNKVVVTNYQSSRMHLETKNEKKKKVTPPKEEDLEEIVLSKETLAKFDLILQDINRKIYASSWRIYID